MSRVKDCIICDLCQAIFDGADAEYSAYCVCGYWFCSYECAGMNKEISADEQECLYCRGEDLPDNLLLKFLLKRQNLSRPEAVKLYFSNKNEKILS